MRIESVDLLRFGHFCGHRIEFPPRQPDYHLIYGDNEAGKSTLLRGISNLFFGVPVKTPDIHSCKGPELRIGATISDGKGRFSFRRRKGTTGTLLNLNEGQISEDALKPFLRELDRERFEQFFGLTHDRLREGGEELLRGQGDVGSALFQAAGLLDLRRLLEKLDDEARELFSPKSRTKTISRAIEEYRQAKLELRRIAISAATVRQKQTELEAAKEALEKLKTESHSLQEDVVRLQRIESNKPDLARLHDLRTALADWETVPALPIDARRQFDEATAALAYANGQITTLTQAMAQREKRIQDLPANSLFKGHESEIEELNAGTSAYIQSIGDRTKRQRERDDAIQVAEADWKGTWPGPVQDAENLRNAYAGKEEILNLVAEHKGLTAESDLAKEELQNVEQEQQHLQEELARHTDVPDPAGLIAAIEHAKTLGDTELAGAKLRREIERLTQNAKREMRKLAQWAGTLQELEDLKAPLLTTIEQYGREWQILDRRAELTERHARAIEVIREKQGELERLASQVAEAGQSELNEVRARREQLWQFIRASAFDKTMTRAEAQRRSGSSVPLAEAFAEHLQRADQIADARFANAREVAIHDRLVKEIAAAREEQQRAEAEIDRLQAAEQKLRERWNDEWSELGSAPLTPPEMKEWMQLRQAILEQFAQSQEKEDELNSLQERAALAGGQIKAQLAALGGRSANNDGSLPVLIKLAEGLAAELAEEKRTVNDLRRQLQSLTVERRQAKLDECDHRLAAWSQKWAPQLYALLLPETSTPDQVARALVVLEKVFDQLKDAARLQHRVNRIGDNIELFEKRVSQLVAAVDPSYLALSPDAAVKQLHWHLVELGNAGAERKTLLEQNKRDTETVAGCHEKVKIASETLNRLMALAHCTDGGEQQLEAVISAAEQKSETQQEYDRIARGLRERNAVADLAQVEQEASAYDLDSLQSEILIKTDRLKNSVEEISKAASLHGELTSEFERLEASEESALQAQKAEDALAQLRPAVAQYLRLRLAWEVLQQAIESYRERHQGPILTRASELFSRLTLDRYSGLMSDFGNDDKQVLAAVRRNAERVYVEGLSDGTRDQLYLALRLAAIEHHVETVAPCPVIFDDLLINSDDERSLAALQVIGELAKRTQVLFFTHHRRLAELGSRSGAQMIELSSIAASAVA